MVTRLAGVLALALFCVGAVVAAEGDAAPKPEEKTFTGALAAKAADAPAGVVAVLNTTAAKSGGHKKAAVSEPSKSYNLQADGDVATKLGTLAAAGAKVIVKGTENPDGSLKVSSVEEDKGTGGKPGKGGHGKH